MPISRTYPAKLTQPPFAGIVSIVSTLREYMDFVVARQKRIVIDGEDFYLDLLFYRLPHRQGSKNG